MQLLNISSQKEDMLTGQSVITDLIRIHKIREDLYLQAVDKPAHPDFVKAVIDLYSDMFEYQARLIIYRRFQSSKPFRVHSSGMTG